LSRLLEIALSQYGIKEIGGPEDNMEIFKIIKHHPNYEISNYGRVRNRETGKILKTTPHVRKGRKDPTKYLRIELKRPRSKHLVHRLVAEAFLPNPEDFESINHIDENGMNNFVDNLEWCTHRYNCIYSRAKITAQLTTDGELVKTYKSLTEAAESTGSDFRLISSVCLGKRKTHNGFKWVYIN
jgi:hypothetical protein